MKIPRMFPLYLLMVVAVVCVGISIAKDRPKESIANDPQEEEIGEQMANLTVRFGTDMTAKIAQVAKERDIDQKELLRRAIALYIYLTNETRDGSRRAAIIATESDKVIKDIDFR